MSLFDDDQPPKKPKVVAQAKTGGRRRRKQQEKEEERTPRVYPPLMIRARVSEQEEEQPLEEYIGVLYSTNVGEKRSFQKFLKENDEGDTEYKLKLILPSDDRLDHLATQMKFRIREGHGEAHYRIGVEDSGKPTGLNQEDMLQSLKTICLLAGRVRADVMVLRVSDGLHGLVIELIIRERHRQGVTMEIRVLLLGQSSSGKSTLLGVLKSGEKDNGKGYARGKVLTHKHEIMSGTTQSRSHHVIGFDQKGNLYNKNCMMSMEKWLDNANKLLTFIDVGGHRKAEKQVVSTLCSFFPEYALWVVSAVDKMYSSATIELAAIFGLPLIVVVTHLDLVNKEKEVQAVLRVKEQLKKFFPDKTPCLVRQMQHAVLFSRITSSEDVIPIFLISSVSGRNLDLLTSFFNLLTASSQLRMNEEMSTQFAIAEKFVIDGQMILAGTVTKGILKRGQLLHLGPDTKGAFRTVEVKSVECLRVPVKLAKCGQICTVSIRPLSYAKEWLQRQPNAIRRGMVLVDAKLKPKAVYEFSVELTPYSSEREQFTISSKNQPVINTLCTRQICQIVILKQQNMEPVLPNLLDRKKSKSIDTKKIEKAHHSHKSIDSKSPQLPSKKSSVDLTCESSKEIPQKLQPIAEQFFGKKKEVAQIHFETGSTTLLRLRFKYYPEYITVGQRIVIGELRVVGRVKEIFY